MKKVFLLLVLVIITFSCQNNTEKPKAKSSDKASKFYLQSQPNKLTGINFKNTVNETATLNYLKYESIYNGAGVAIGDINNDGLPDIYFAGNSSDDKLYLNKGDFEFEDISTKSGINLHAKGWSTGVNMTDINADGYLDIYVCRSGVNENLDVRRNKLFINQKDGTFKESSKQYGLDLATQSRQTAFFDYDLDGDLDMYLMNEPEPGFKAGEFYDYIKQLKNKELQSDFFYENIDGKFIDRTAQAGLINFGYGHSIAVGDVNNDGYPDFHITHDYDDPDMLFMNTGNKSFVNETNNAFKHVSWSSMGNDLADINNDGLLDLFVLEMAPEDHFNSKVNMKAMAPEKFLALAENDQQYQYMFNTLQLNNGNTQFSEIAQLSGLAKTDWSWAPLFFDIDFDGNKDVFITNGIKRNFSYRDLQTQIRLKSNALGRNINLNELHEIVPSQLTYNTIHQNNGDLTFKKITSKWIDKASFNSNGAALGDLDNDGDLDLVVNNMESMASIYKNNATEMPNNYLKFTFKGSDKNPNALGTKVSLKTKNGTQIQELQNVRGYLSSSNYELVFGLGDESIVEEISITWPNGEVSELRDTETNTTILLDFYKIDRISNTKNKDSKGSLANVDLATLGIKYQHKENTFDDYKEQILLPHSQAQNGPFIAKGDVNGDGNEDIYIGGARGQAGELYLQISNGKFQRKVTSGFQNDSKFEDLGAIFFDADQDGDLDLYVTSGGASLIENHVDYQDRLYKNDGKGNFSRDFRAIPENLTSNQIVAKSDIDNDGDLDLFIGGRIIPNKYPYSPKSIILINNEGQFNDETNSRASYFESLGLITGANFFDFDKDGDEDLITAGEWSTIEVHENNNGVFKKLEISSLKNTRGLWFSLSPIDINNDGNLDFIAGNIGLNTKFKANDKKQFHVFCDDFDDNGTYDVVLSNNYKGNLVPVRGRECSSEQMPFIKDKFQTFESFAEADITSIYGQEKLDKALHYQADLLESILLVNQGNGQFEIQKLPINAQLAPIMDAALVDLNKDGEKELMYVGNLFNVEVETVRYDSGTGGLMKWNNNALEVIPNTYHGFNANSDARKIIELNNLIIITNNNDQMNAYQIN